MFYNLKYYLKEKTENKEDLSAACFEKTHQALVNLNQIESVGEISTYYHYQSRTAVANYAILKMASRTVYYIPTDESYNELCLKLESIK